MPPTLACNRAWLARSRYQCSRKLAAGRRTEVQLNRPLALVQPSPKQALPVGGERPSLIIKPAASLVETDNICSQLSERHPAQRSCDEGRTLDHP